MNSDAQHISRDPANNTDQRRQSIWTRTDLIAVLVVALVYVAMVGLTWQRWTHPFVDHGREMNVPARIIDGDRLYIDIIHYYGPLAPHLNALLYRVFGVHLAMLHMAGGICGAFVVLLVYWLARRLLHVWEAAIAAGAVTILCASSVRLGSYIQPYTFAALYGWVFALASLACVVRFMESRRLSWIVASGIFLGLTVAYKPELALLNCVSILTGFILCSRAERRIVWRPFAMAVPPAVIIAVVAWAPVVLFTPWLSLAEDIGSRFSQPQMVLFARHLSGTLDWRYSAWAFAAAIGSVCCIGGLAAFIGNVLQPPSSGRYLDARGWASLAATGVGWWLWGLEARVPLGYFDHTPLRAAPLVLLLAPVGPWARRHGPTHGSAMNEQDILLLYSAFGLASVLRVFLNVSVRSAYTPFTVPILIIVLLHFWCRTMPALLTSTPGSQRLAQRAMMVFTTGMVLLAAVHSVLIARSYSSLLAAERGRLWVSPVFGGPLADALKFVSARTSRNDYLVSLPQGTIINFLAERRNPLKEENIVPGFVTGEDEQAVIRRISERRVPLILVSNILTPEYRDRAFGLDYNVHLMAWIEAHYTLAATFSHSRSPTLRLGDKEFFVRVYERNDGSAHTTTTR